jgi:glycosyltransferase involved in cell wall biosynthesis
MGHLDEEQKFKLLQRCDWYVLPSKSENFGISVLESLAIGLPVIISKEVGISSIVLQYKAGYIVGDQVSLKDALHVALKGSPVEMKIAALKLATERFSWREIIKKLIFFYDQQIFSRVKQ